MRGGAGHVVSVEFIFSFREPDKRSERKLFQPGVLWTASVETHTRANRRRQVEFDVGAVACEGGRVGFAPRPRREEPDDEVISTGAFGEGIG